jgi:hypothetical protein
MTGWGPFHRRSPGMQIIAVICEICMLQHYAFFINGIYYFLGIHGRIHAVFVFME